MAQGQHASFTALEQAMDLQSGLLELYQTNADAIQRAAPGGVWESPELYAYTRHIHSQIADLIESGRALCGLLNTTASAAHAHTKWEGR
jgi:hypothetical protein